MDRPARQRRVGGRGGHVVLEGQFAAQQVGLGRLQEGQHHRHRLVPPGQAAQVGLAAVEVAAARCSRASISPTAAQWAAIGASSLCPGSRFTTAAGLPHSVCRMSPSLVALRVGHRNAALGQVLHQVQVEGQLREAQALEQRQHPLAAPAVLLGGEEVVGVLDAAVDAAQGDQLTQPQP